MRWQARFADLKAPRIVWVIAAIHGHAVQLGRLHDDLVEHIGPGDRLVYCGDFLGVGTEIRETVTELLDFRRAILSIPGFLAADVVYLRGRQEDYLVKAQQLQFTQKPEAELHAALADGLAETFKAYQVDAAAGLRAARDGPVALTRWTLALKAHLRTFPGHLELLAHLRRAAVTTPGATTSDTGNLLIVNAGLDPDRALIAQQDTFWRESAGFDRIKGPYGLYARVIRGFDPHNRGLQERPYTLSLDGGCRSGGPLICAGLRADGTLERLLEAQA